MGQKRKSKVKVKKVRAAKKKASVIKRLKVKARPVKPQAKKQLRAKLPASARGKIVAKAAPAKPAAAPVVKPGKAPKTPIKSAKQALELLEAKVAEVKTKGKGGRGGRTTDPVRMYMREMGSVELLTREGEIEIAKRIEEGLRHMIQAISACPTTVQEILDLAGKVEKDEMRIDEVVDGLIDPNAKDDFDPKKAQAPEEEEAQIEEEEGESEDDDGAAQKASLLALRTAGLEKFARIRRLYEKMTKALENKGSKDRDYLRAREQISNELMTIRFTARTVERLSDSGRGLVDETRRHDRAIID